MNRYAIRHETRYDYAAPVDLGFHVLHLTPRVTARQSLRAYRLAIAPQPTRLDRFVDHFGNDAHYVGIETSHDRFTATVEAEVVVAGSRVPEHQGPSWEAIREAMQGDGLPAPPEVAEFIHASPLAAIDDEAAAYAAASFGAEQPIVACLRDLIARIRRDFVYTPKETDISTGVAEVLRLRRGVCQDFAHVMIAGLRGLGLPARYVSGYIRTQRIGSPATLIGSDASHAWVSVWCGDNLGWIEFDPTNNLVVGDEHVVVAFGRDFSDVTPLRGVILGSGNHSLSVSVSVVPLVVADPEEKPT